MSYCRMFDGDNPDGLYIYISMRTGDGPGRPVLVLVCCSCPLNPGDFEDRDNFESKKLKDFLAHLDDHERAGHKLPPGLRERITEDWPNRHR